MTNDFFELNRVIGELSRARNVFESQAAYEHLKKALATETTEVELQEVLSSLRDMVHASVLSDALIDYNNQPELYPERASTMINLLPKFQEKCSTARPEVEDVKRLQGLCFRINELGECKTEAEIRSLVDELSANFERHPEYREAGYSWLRREIENDIILAYMHALFSKNRDLRAQTNVSLLLAIEEHHYHGYPLDFLYFENGYYDVLTPENLCEERDVATLRKKLNVLHPALIHLNVPAYSAYMDGLTYKIAGAVLNTLKSLTDWTEVSETTKLLAQYLGNLLNDGLRGLTESVKGQVCDRAVDYFIYAQYDLNKVCSTTDVSYMENAWSSFLLNAASSPNVDAFSRRAILALTVSLLSTVDTGNLPETLQCLIRFLTVITTCPMSITYDDNIIKWIANGDVA